MKKFIVSSAFVTMATLLSGAVAPLANAQAFLCPVVGDGVLNADTHNGDNGVSAITPPVGTLALSGAAPTVSISGIDYIIILDIAM